MSVWTHIWKPWFVYRPQQLWRRLFRNLRTAPDGYHPLRTAWGASIEANPRDDLGWSLWTTGVFDLAVSELLFRLIKPGDTVVDAGANVGYMTVLAAVAAGPAGRVVAFEPNPRLVPVLERNVKAAAGRFSVAPVELRDAALGARAGTALFAVPDPASANDGLGRVLPADAGPTSRTVPVRIEALDDILGTRAVAVLKVDVEGHEHPLLVGAAEALRSKRIRHILFEDHHGPSSDAAQLLTSAGYALFSVSWSLRRLQLLNVESSPRPARDYEAQTYLATVAVADVARICAASGWLVLRTQTREKPRDARG